MRVIVSTSITENYSHYTIVPSIAQVLDMENVDCVILHSYSDNDVIFASAIADIRKKFSCNFFYITSQPKAVVVLLLNGIQGIIIEDDFYYENEADLDDLLESYGVNSTSLAVSDTQSSLSIVRDFVASYARGEERCSLPYFIQQTNLALTELESVIGRQELQIQEMGSSAIEVFKRASGYITALEEKNKVFSQQLESLTQQSNAPRRQFGAGGISFFPTVKYNPSPTKKVLVIREFSPCKYLTSFILSYQTYLKTMKNKRVKVVFTVQKGKLIYTKYSSDMFSFISQESVAKNELYGRDIIVTNAPQNQVLTKIIDTGTYDIVIVVDRLYGGDVILNGNGVKHLAAVGGSSDLSRFKLNPRSCIFSHIDYQGSFLTIPTISKYPPASAIDMRVSAYAQMCNMQKLYDKMDNFIEVNARR